MHRLTDRTARIGDVTARESYDFAVSLVYYPVLPIIDEANAILGPIRGPGAWADISGRCARGGMHVTFVVTGL